MRKNVLMPVSVILSVILMICSLTVGCGKKEQSSAAYSSQSTKIETVTQTTEETESRSEKENTSESSAETVTVEEGKSVSYDGSYTSKEEVAAYINEFGCLPSNYITKTEAKELGWISNKGNLWDVAYGKSIGGDRFGNYEGNLPDKKGRKYYECDIGYEGGFRGAERIIYSDDGLIYYTEDHYQTFELLYGEE